MLNVSLAFGGSDGKAQVAGSGEGSPLLSVLLVWNPKLTGPVDSYLLVTQHEQRLGKHSAESLCL